jgi:hypothetical protein
MKLRILLASALLFVMISFAVSVNLLYDSTPPANTGASDLLRSLIFENGIRAFFHLMGFAAITALVGHQPGNIKLMWVIGFVTAGGVLLEISQYLSSGHPVSTSQVLDSGFDMIVNHTGAALALIWLSWRSV